MPQENQHRGVVKREDYEPTDLSFSQGTTYILAIAIDEYDRHQKLFNAVKDAEDIIQVLLQRYDCQKDKVVRLYNKAANKPEIFGALDDLTSKVTDKDSVLIYYAGHGYYHESNNTGHLIPQSAGDKVWDYISNANLKDHIRAINSLHTFLIIDSCFSGSLFSQSRIAGASMDTSILNFTQRVGARASRWCLAAGMIEEVGDGRHGENSPFAQAVLSFLKTNQDSQFPASALVQYVKKVTPNNAKQTPIGGILFKMKDLGGEFIFRLKRNAQADWKYVKEANKVSTFRAFLTNYPTSPHRDEASWLLAKKQGTITAFLSYRKGFPQGEFKSAANDAIHALEDEKAWQKAIRRDKLASYLDYMDDFPSGKYLTQAQAKVNQINTPSKPSPPSQEVNRKEEIPIATPSFTKTVSSNKEAQTVSKTIKTKSSFPWQMIVSVLVFLGASFGIYTQFFDNSPNSAIQNMSVTKKMYEDYWTTGQTAMRLKDYKTAKANFEKAAPLASTLGINDQQLRNALAICDKELKKWEIENATFFREFKAGNDAMREKKYKTAKEHYEKAVPLGEKLGIDVEPYVKQIKEAITACDKEIKKGGSSIYNDLLSNNKVGKVEADKIVKTPIKPTTKILSPVLDKVTVNICGKTVSTNKMDIAYQLPLYLKGTYQKNSFSLNQVKYSTGKADIKNDAAGNQQLNNVVAILKCYPNTNIKIGVHSDNRGNDSANLRLTKSRANSVKKYLVSKGISSNRIDANGYGETKPIANNTTTLGRAANRRTEVIVTKK